MTTPHAQNVIFGTAAAGLTLFWVLLVHHNSKANKLPEIIPRCGHMNPCEWQARSKKGESQRKERGDD